MNTNIRLFFFITGAPRSGTTFLSDWITQSKEAYCVHEVLNDIRGKSVEDLTLYMANCSKNGYDRFSKTQQLKFLDWQKIKVKTDPTVLGLKQPIIWFSTENFRADLHNFFDLKPLKMIVLIRHPFDVIASGKHRANHTNNWPNYSTEDHCKFWQTSFDLIESWNHDSKDNLVIFWKILS